MLGNCAMGRLDIATKPMITIRMAMTIATMGRLMKNLAMTQESRTVELCPAVPQPKFLECGGKRSATPLL